MCSSQVGIQGHIQYKNYVLIDIFSVGNGQEKQEIQI